MLHRLRAHMKFAPGSGLAQWCYDQMTVRYGQAVHIRPGELAEESPVNIVEGDIFRCDLPLMDEAAAVDALATLSDPNVLGVTVPLGEGEETVLSWTEHHTCDHDEDVRSGCSIVTKNYGPAAAEASSEWQPDVAYAVDDEVTYQESWYVCTMAHTSQVGWEPDVATTLWSPL